MRKRLMVEKLRTLMREEFPRQIDEAFKERFGREVETTWSIVAMALVSAPKDGKKLTPEQGKWLQAFSDGYSKAAHSLAAL